MGPLSFLLLGTLAISVNSNLVESSVLRPDLGIYGGQDASIYDYPHQVAIEYILSLHICGGSIISPEYIVTAAHCAPKIKFLQKVRAGTSQRGKGGSTHKISKVIVHEEFGRMGAFVVNDIALIKVTPAFQFDEVRQPIELFKANEESLAGAQSNVTGWGSTPSSSMFGPKTLQVVSVPIVGKEECAKDYQQFGVLPEGFICAGGHGKNVCNGDSGGPLKLDGRLAGIVSQGETDCAGPNPAIYTEVAAYRDWIDSHLETSLE
ncbi:hypothetical protein QAD02_022722 [Eretmocerus hayati]|uniref:Uncharacterized protein n=1 Tax=Eretmocerus hayati TaxID=131215 RepID=A0ACC2PUY3_9HYME|nr:hypothetical protein QAD02_022722 [Eretmocerus hayati]